jgi:release factor glutamine methyltransferase
MTVLDTIKRSTEFLEGKGVESARLQAELLVGHAIGLTRMQLYLQFERPLGAAELDRIRDFIRRRGRREPAQYILGGTEFFGLRLKVDRRALIPRPETEFLVETAVSLWPTAPAKVLDLGTGSGAIALALAAAWPASEVTAVDSSPDALELARENASGTGLSGRVVFLLSNWFAALPAGARFDLILANPPYLSAEEVAAAPPEVRAHEPAAALESPREGRADLEAILGAAPRFLARGGLLAMETGIGQHADLLRLAHAGGFAKAESRPDLTGRDRFLLAWAGTAD